MPIKKWKTIKSKYALKTPHIKVRQDTCRDLQGNKLDYYVVEKSNSAGIVALTPDNKIILERQYRHPHKKWVVQIPAGHIEKNERPTKAIRRELLEETGYQVKKVIQLNKFFPTCSSYNSTFILYLGFKAIKIQDPKSEKGEDLEIFLVCLDKALTMVKQGKIQDMDSATAILLAKQYLDQNRLILFLQKILYIFKIFWGKNKVAIFL